VTIRFLEIAEIELDQAVHWYGAQAPGLGEAFLIEVLSRCGPHRAFSRWSQAFAAATSVGSRTD
jgi:hypothetical protein